MTDTLQSPLEGAVLFYKQPEPLDPAQHQTLGVNAAEKPYAFVGQTNFVPLTVTEFAAAALSYPVIFMGAQKQPAAVMGLRNGENLFVSPEGDFRPDAYIPAFVRRYPFVFADDKSNQRLILCVDRGADIVVEVGGAGTLAQSIRAVAPGGHIALIGVLTGFAAEVPTAEMMFRQARAQGLIVGSREHQRDMVRALEGFDWRPVVDRSYRLDQIAEAFAWQKAGNHFGKICLEW